MTTAPLATNVAAPVPSGARLLLPLLPAPLLAAATWWVLAFNPTDNAMDPTGYSTVLRNLPWEPFTWFYVPDLIPMGR